MNNLKSTDYVNVVVQALCHVRPLRDFLLVSELATYSPLVRRFGELMRKLWSAHNFKNTVRGAAVGRVGEEDVTHVAQVSPHELLQEVSTASKRRFVIGTQSESVQFITWFLARLHLDLVGGAPKVPPPTPDPHATGCDVTMTCAVSTQGARSDKSSVVQDSFQGQVSARQRLPKAQQCECAHRCESRQRRSRDGSVRAVASPAPLMMWRRTAAKKRALARWTRALTPCRSRALRAAPAHPLRTQVYTHGGERWRQCVYV